MIIVLIMAVSLPSLQHARVDSRRKVCASQLATIGQGWLLYLADHNDQFPTVSGNNPWMWGGVQVSNDQSIGALDPTRPINPYLPAPVVDEFGHHICMCPADCGVTDTTGQIGTGRRSAFSSFGTSYRANAQLLDASDMDHVPEDTFRGVRRNEITTPPSRMLVLGDPVWFEALEQTGRDANWHEEAATGNLLFLDGSVRYVKVLPRDEVGPVVVDPIMIGTKPRIQRRSEKE